MLRQVSAVLVTVLFGACANASAIDEKQRPPGACETSSAILLGSLTTLVSEGPSFAQPSGWQGVFRNEPGTPLPDVAVVALMSGSSSVNGMQVSDEELGNILRNKRALALTLGEPSGAVALAVDRRVAWSRVVRIASMARDAGYQDFHWVFTTAGSAEPKSVWHDGLRSSAAPRLVFREEILDDCTSGKLSDDQLLAPRDVAAAYAACGCRADATAIRDVFWVAMGRHRGPAVTTIPMRCSGPDDPAAERIERPSTNLFETVAAALAEASLSGKPIAIVASGSK